MLYRYRIKPKSPLMTPLMSDTFFGHFCWALRYVHGESYLENFLDSYGLGKTAPVIFSSAFISGYLPRPTLPPLKRENIIAFVKDNFGSDRKSLFEGMALIKKWNQRRLLSIEQWLSLCDNFSKAAVVRLFYDSWKEDKYAGDPDAFQAETDSANTIDRISGTVLEEGGGLFTREKLWNVKSREFDLYVDINDKDLHSDIDYFLNEYLTMNGFGADKSIGMGELVITKDSDFDPSIFDVSESNAKIALSLTSFPGMEQYTSYYRLMVKFGKLGGEFATHSPTGGNPRPFKKPILMFEPGAVFITSDDLNDRPLLEGVHSDTRIRHCGIPVTLNLKIEEFDSHAVKAA